MGTLIRLALRRTLGQIRHVSRVRPGRGGDLVVGVHRQVEADFGLLAPPIALHTAAPPALAAAWAMLRESLVARGRVARSAKESVAAGVSERNRCPYCVEVHSATLAALDAEPSEVDPLAEWARTGGGAVAPFPCTDAPEVVGTAVTFHYLNRMVSVFLGDSPLPPAMPASARDTARQVLGKVMRPHAVREHRPGRSLEFLSPPNARTTSTGPRRTPCWPRRSPARTRRSTASPGEPSPTTSAPPSPRRSTPGTAPRSA
ncbi:carboxymuconolactone decarboxylase family protein [Actinokineospora soli]|uniref:Carboxymuconolactone decarboxylase family protein n=1 Tax=Actinokineospora soli TaxID=1048753 RepID=A0ABW2TRE7_9PSEU